MSVLSGVQMDTFDIIIIYIYMLIHLINLDTHEDNWKIKNKKIKIASLIQKCLVSSTLHLLKISLSS